MKRAIVTFFTLLIALLFSVVAFADSLGDVDSDGTITAADARLALRASVGLENYAKGTSKFTASDVDSNGIITAADARLILRASVGLENTSSWNKTTPSTPAKEEPTTQPGPQAGSTYKNPLPSDGKNILTYSAKPERKISVRVKQIITGEKADEILEHEHNEKADAGYEWRLYIFDISYISSANGDNDMLEAWHIIDEDNFYTSQGSKVKYQEKGLLYQDYQSRNPFYVEMYPGTTSEVALALLVPENDGDYLLRLSASNGTTWIKLTPFPTAEEKAQQEKEAAGESGTELTQEDYSSKEYIAAAAIVLLKGQLKNPSSYKLNNIVYSGNTVYIWYSAQNGFGAKTDGFVSVYYSDEKITVGSIYSIEVGSGYAVTNLKASRPNVFDGYLDSHKVDAYFKTIGTIHYHYSTH